MYLCNGSEDAIEEATASLVGATASLDYLSPTTDLSDDGVLVTSTETRRVECLPARHMSLISNYDVIFDGDTRCLPSADWPEAESGQIDGVSE